MAVSKQRLHRKNSDGSYDVVYLENIATNVRVSETDDTTIDGFISKYLPITLPAANWVADGDDWKQTITIASGTVNTLVNLQGDKTTIKQMMEDNTSSIYVENTDGVFTAYAVGSKPSADLTVYATVNETVQISG